MRHQRTFMSEISSTIPSNPPHLSSPPAPPGTTNQSTPSTPTTTLPLRSSPLTPAKTSLTPSPLVNPSRNTHLPFTLSRSNPSLCVPSTQNARSRRKLTMTTVNTPSSLSSLLEEVRAL